MKTRIVFTLAMTILSSQTFAIPVPVYGNTYEVTEIPANAGSAADFNIATAVRQKIAMNQDLLRVNPRVTSLNGVVSFEGTFDSLNEAKQLIDIALNVPGVTDIDVSKLIQRGGIRIPDDMLVAARVKLLFVKQQLFGKATTPATLPVTVTTATVIYLTGTVDSKEQAQSAIDLAKSVPGVADAVGNFTIRGGSQ